MAIGLSLYLSMSETFVCSFKKKKWFLIMMFFLIVLVLFCIHWIVKFFGPM